MVSVVKNNRNASLDALRLIAMMMIVSLHYFGWGGINHASEALAFNRLFASVGSIVCRVAVDIFFILSGFLIKKSSKKITGKAIAKKVVPFWIKVFCYSAFIYLLLVLVGLVNFSIGDLFRALTPIMSKQYWFATVWILIICVRPFLAKLLTSLDKKELLIFVGILLFFDTIQSVFGVNGFAERGYGFLNAFTMVVLGYVINNISQLRIKRSMCVLIFVMGIVLAAGGAILLQRHFNYDENVTLFYNSPMIVVSAACMVQFFSQTTINVNFISKIAPHLFAVYLINDHPQMQEVFWENVLHCSDFYTSKWMCVHYLLCVIGYIIVGVGIDLIVSAFVKKIRRER